MVDLLAYAAGWSASGGASILPVNEIPQFIAGGQSSSLVFGFAAASFGQYVEKALSPSVDLSAYTELVMSVYLVRKHGYVFEQQSDYVVQVDFGDGKTYLIPTNGTFTHVTIPIAYFGTVSASRIRFTYLGADLDYLCVSYLVASNPEMPADIIAGVVEGIKSKVTELYGSGVLIGTATGSVSGTELTFGSDTKWLSRNAVVLISDGTSSETHQLMEVQGVVGILGQMYDGPELKNAFTNANVYLQLPVEENKLQREAPMPGIVVWTAEPDPIIIASDFDGVQLGWGPTGPALTLEGRIEEWRIGIYCQAFQQGPLGMATTAVRRWLSQHIVWVNGAKIEYIWKEAATYEEPSDPSDLQPSVLYTVEIQIREEVWPISTAIAAQAPTVTPSVVTGNLP